MAKKARNPKRKAGRKKAAPERIVEAALTLAARSGWRRVRLADIAAETGLTLAELRTHFPTKRAIISGFLQQTDEKVLASGPAEGTSARDRLFEVLMRRFDALAPYRNAVGAIVGAHLCDPAQSLCQLPRLLCSMAWMLEAAGLSSAGIGGALRSKGLAVVYLAALRVWLTDDSNDLAKTMAALDRGLRQAETLAGVIFSTGHKNKDKPVTG